jgi:kumamolisin
MTVTRKAHRLSQRWIAVALASIVALPAILTSAEALAQGAPQVATAMVRVPRGDVIVANARDDQVVRFALTLPYRDPAAVEDFLKRLYTPGDSLYRNFLKSDEFDQRFGPTTTQYEALKAMAARYGLNVVGEHSGHTVLDVAASSATIRAVFGAQVQVRRTAEGANYFAADRLPSVPREFSAMGATVTSLIQRPLKPNLVSRGRVAAPHPGGPNAGSGSEGLLQPADIRKGYNGTSLPTSGQPVAVYELSTATYTDVAKFASTYGLNNPTLTHVNVDGGTTDTSGTAEVILDIELVVALANPTKVYVYTAPNGSGILDLYTQIADDDLVNQMSTSWGGAESAGGTSFYQAEGAEFQKMAGEGLAAFAASGDAGAYEDSRDESAPYTLLVQDPSSQPYVTGVGGTTLTLDTAQNYVSEAAWGDTADTQEGPAGTGGGGGISIIWTIPTYQHGVVSKAPAGQFSTTMRNVPDVALAGSFDNADSSYLIYLTPPGGSAGWYGYSGTSAAAPLWASFWSLVGQGLGSAGVSPARAGFANPVIYPLAENATSFARDFHDVKDGSTNLYYKTVAGYDLATGWGSFNADNLFTDIINSFETAPLAPTNLNATAGIGTVTLNWTASSGATTYRVYEGTTAGGESTTAVKEGVVGTTSVFTTAAPGKAYYYKVAALKKTVLSPLSNEATAAATAPAAPAGLTAVAGSSAGTITLTWNASTGAKTYQIFKGTTSGGETSGASASGVTATQYTFSGLTSAKAYYFKVAGVVNGVAGPHSTEAHAIAP